jgi:predicted CXXCH cytochrome family protein
VKMKRLSSSIVLLMLLVGAGHAGVLGSKHDLSLSGSSQFQYDTVQVCVFCHTPHEGNVDDKYGGSGGLNLRGYLIWNRNTPGYSSFDMYDSESLDYTEVSPQPGPVSVMCLSCHDGAGAMNVLLNLPGSAGGPGALDPAPFSGVTTNQFGDFSLDDPFVGPLNIGEAVADGDLGSAIVSPGTNLTNDHPIGFVYNAALATADGELATPVSDKQVDAAGLVRLFEGKLECSSCHEPHNNQYGAFLAMDNTDSALCRVCHLK